MTATALLGEPISSDNRQHDRPEAASDSTTARWTGIFYLGLAIAGLVGFLLVRSELFVADDSSATLANLINHAELARIGIAADISAVLTQALAAVWFFKLFRRENSLAAGAIAAFGLVNAAAITVATAFSATALAVAGDPSLAPGGDQEGTVQLLYTVSGTLWGIGGLFFGLWLVPMGYVIVTRGLMPVTLGWILLVGGVAYVVGTYLAALAPDSTESIGSILVGLATIGEFWMIGYLLIFGVRSVQPQEKG